MTTPTHPIKELTIKGFKSIRNMSDFELNNLNILIGANGSGKSNFVSYFRLLGELLDNRLQIQVRKEGGANRILSYGIKKTKEFYSFIKFGDNGYEFRLGPTVDGSLIFMSEKLFYKEKYRNLGSGYLESKLKEKAHGDEEDYHKVAEYCYNSITSWRVYHFHDTSNTAGIKQAIAVQDNLYLRPDASNLAAFLYKLKNIDLVVYKDIIKTINLALPYFDDFILEPEELRTGEKQVNLVCKQTDSDYPFWPSQLSDGSIRFICLVTALLQPNPPSTIIIDEPELGLHPYAITLLGGLLRSASTKMQVIVSTQSVELLNEFKIEDLIIVERENGESIFKRVTDDTYHQWLEQYTLGELWERNVLGGRPHP